MARPDEIEAMRRALAQGQMALGTTSPNPPVGCVVLDRTGAVVGEGHTQPPGGPHAEVMALRAAGERARGGTAVVTLEPCTHVGRTGPCAEALLAAGIARVVYATRDHNPSAAHGHERLAAAGVDVEGGVLRTEAEHGALEPWLSMIRNGRPHVTWHVAATLDGHATADALTANPTVRSDVHTHLRHTDVILLDACTTSTEPHPTPTGPEPAREPLAVTVDHHTTPPTARIGTDQVEVPRTADGSTDLGALLGQLRERDIVSVTLTGEPHLAAALHAAGMIDRIFSYLTGHVLGTAGTPPLSATPGAATPWSLDAVDHLGDAIRITARPTAHATTDPPTPPQPRPHPQQARRQEVSRGHR